MVTGIAGVAEEPLLPGREFESLSVSFIQVNLFKSPK